jgi:hypothetical protein
MIVTTGGMSTAAMVTGDFNGDGKLDLIASSPTGTGIVFAMAGNGDGTFAAPVTLGTGLVFAQLIAVDLNGDGKLDLAAANNMTFSAALVMLYTGPGFAFSAPAAYATTTPPTSITATDFNNDGKIDLALATSAGQVSVFPGTGGGAFGTQLTFGAPAGQNLQAIAAGDLNSDGKPDLVCGNSTTNFGALLLNTSTATISFGAATTLAAGGPQSSVVIADFNSDGKNDVAFTAIAPPIISVLPGNGDGTFSMTNADPTPSGPRSILTADFNADGKPDIADANGGANNVSVLLGVFDGNCAGGFCCNGAACVAGNTLTTCGSSGACVNCTGSGDACTAGACTCGGVVCPGQNNPTDVVTCTAGACGMECIGENYDVNNSANDGCEKLHPTPPGPDHSTTMSWALGTWPCNDTNMDAFNSQLDSDSRTHVMPPVQNFNGTVGSAPDVWSIIGTGSGACLNDYGLTFTTSGGSSPASCYQLIFQTDKTTVNLFNSGSQTSTASDSCTVFNPSCDYSNGATLYFTVQKICNLPIQETVSYSVQFHL